MTDRPILFTGEMVRAILDGRKTQTRRVINGCGELPEFCGGRYDDKNDPSNYGWENHDLGEWITLDMFRRYRFVPYAAGDRLWVREAFTYITDNDGLRMAGRVLYRSDGKDNSGARWASVQPDDPEREVLWKPSIFMPRWASRLTLTVTDVRVQRVADIDRGDAMDEGCPFANMADGPDPREWFRDLWDSINAKRGFGWDVNPWVAAYTFTS